MHTNRGTTTDFVLASRGGLVTVLLRSITRTESIGSAYSASNGLRFTVCIGRLIWIVRDGFGRFGNCRNVRNANDIGNIGIILDCSIRAGRLVRMVEEQNREVLRGLSTVSEISEMLGVSRITIHTWRKYRGLPYVVIPGDTKNAIRFRKKDVLEWAREKGVKVKRGANGFRSKKKG